MIATSMAQLSPSKSYLLGKSHQPAAGNRFFYNIKDGPHDGPPETTYYTSGWFATEQQARDMAESWAGFPIPWTPVALDMPGEPEPFLNPQRNVQKGDRS